MFKFMRKYNRWLLAIFGSFLMLTFLFSGTQSIFQPNQEKIVLATTNTKPIRQAEYEHARRELEFLEAFDPQILANLRLKKNDVEHWVLLCREATAAGMLGEAGDGKDLINSLVRSRLSQSQNQLFSAAVGDARTQLAKEKNVDAAQLSPTDVYQKAQALLGDASWIDGITRQFTDAMNKGVPIAAGRARFTSEEEGFLTLAKARAVDRLSTLNTFSTRLSDKRVAMGVRQILNQIQLDGVVIPAARLLTDTPAPSEDKLKELFEKYKAVKPGTGEFGFGYLQPNRVKLEWITVSKASIAAVVKIDPIDANKAWQQNRATYPGEFAAERPKVEQALRDQRVADIMAEIDRVYKADLRRATRTLKVDQGKKLLPADWEKTQPRMEQLAAEIVGGVKDSLKIDIPLPAVTIEANSWTAVQSVANLPGIGGAQYAAGSKKGTLTELVSQVAELDAASGSGLQAAVPYEQSLRDADNNLYFLQILAVAAESVPKDLSEVRADVTKDAHLLAAYDRLVAQKDALTASAAIEGLDKVRALYPNVDTTPAEQRTEDIRQATVSRRQGGGSAVLQVQSVRDAICDAAEKLGEATKPDESNLAQRVLAVPVPSSKAIAVFVITAQEPTSQERVRSIPAMSVRAYMASQELQAAKVDQEDTFSFEELKKRSGYKARREDSDDPKKSSKS